ncbi:hypothetical protein GCM10007981_01910 [Thermocladium modestius]|uniref:DUF3194 domain-containing protein n=1 Tax=Thermocladium modestius TaxID=62609 RepID=A0A830GRR8_9CREN|nr:hypothetical protein GCM10007981_01910 [Thermocladium modestius]
MVPLGQERPPAEAELSRIIEIASKATADFIVSKVPRDFLEGFNVNIEVMDPQSLLISVDVDVEVTDGDAKSLADEASQYCLNILDSLISMHLRGQLDGRSDSEIIGSIQEESRGSGGSSPKP